MLSTTCFIENLSYVAAGKIQRRLGSQMYVMLWLAAASDVGVHQVFLEIG